MKSKARAELPVEYLELLRFSNAGPPWRIVTIDQIAGPESANVIAPNMEVFIEAIGLDAEGQEP